MSSPRTRSKSVSEQSESQPAPRVPDADDTPPLQTKPPGPERRRHTRMPAAPTAEASNGDAPAEQSVTTAAADKAVEAIQEVASQEVTFSLELTQDQKDIRDWVHGFAEDVI